MPPAASEGRRTAAAIALIVLAVAICAGGALLARLNLRKRRGDLIGARRLGVATTGVLLALWACQVHWIADVGLFATFLLAVCTSVFYGVFMATTYVALEPFVRRRWPQIIVSWTSALTGHLSDSIVGRDALFGVALGATLSLMLAIATRIGPGSGTSMPHFGWTDAFSTARLTVGSLLTLASYSVRNSLLLLFVLFLCRVVLRRRWAGVGLFVALFATLNALQNSNPLSGAVWGALYYWISAAAVLRWGLVALTVGEFVRQVVSTVPGSYDLSAWYLPNEALMIGVVVALTAWAFHTATAGRWKVNFHG
jgi:hypothetical protein